MQVSTAVVLAQIIGTFIALYYLKTMISSAKRNSTLAKMVKYTKPLSNKTAVGEYVRIAGKITFPKLKTPYKKKECSLWKATVWAEFKTKAKKPSKGYVTHSPKLLTINSDDTPLIVANGQNNTHVLFDNVSSVVLNSQTETFYQTSPPSEAIAKLAKPKFEKYKIVESWLPPEADVIVLGHLLGGDNACYTISGNPDKDEPPMIFQGDSNGLRQRFTKKVTKAYILMFLQIVFLFAYWWLMPNKFDEVGVFVAVAAGTLISYLMRRINKL